MKKELIVLGFLFLIGMCAVIEITEVELNPEGKDAGAEWVEVYSEEEISLEGYLLMNNDGDEIHLNGSGSGYFVYELERQWLDNSDEKVLLYHNSGIVDETDIFEDSGNDEKTWQVCDGVWELRVMTRGVENGCGEEVAANGSGDEDILDSTGEGESDKEDEGESDKEEPEKDAQEPVIINDKSEGPTKRASDNTERVINLNPQQPRIEVLIYESKNERIKKYSIYGFSVLLIIIIVLLIKR